MQRTTTLPTLVTPRGDSASADRDKIGHRGLLAGRVLGGFIAMIGTALAGGGLWLVLLGGSPYYLLSGTGVYRIRRVPLEAASGGRMGRGRPPRCDPLLGPVGSGL
jgi:hypothetical protein